MNTSSIKPQHLVLTKNTINQVLVVDQTAGIKKQIFYFVPAYLRLKIKNFKEINLESLTAQINCIIFLTIYYGDLDEQLVQQIIDKLNISFQYNKTLTLHDQTESQDLRMKIDEQSKIINFYIYHQLTLIIDPEVFWTPFELISSNLTAVLNTITTQTKNKVKVTIKFNLMDYQNPHLKLFYNPNVHFGYYDIAERLLKAQYTNNNSSYYAFFEKIQSVARNSETEVNINYLKEKQKIKDEKIIKKQSIITKNILQTTKESIRQYESLRECTRGQKQTGPQIAQKLYESQNMKKFSILKKKAQQEVKNLKINDGDEKCQSESEQEDRIYNQTKKLKQLAKIKNFKFAKFHIALYKKPVASIVAIFVPFWLLSLINLGIFFQQPDLSSRIGSIATLLIAFVAFIPTIRQQLPSTPRITFVQILILSQALTCCLCMLQSIERRNEQIYIFHWREDNYFKVSLFVTFLNIISVAFMLLKHILYYERKYNANPNEVIQQKFKPSQWHNQRCCEYFNQQCDELLKDNLKHLSVGNQIKRKFSG